MNRQFLRITLIGMVAIAAIVSLWPSLSAGIGVQVIDSRQSKNPLDTASFSEGVCVDSGVTVVVQTDMAEESKPLVRCVTGEKLSGWQILQVAEFEPTGTSQYRVGFVCRLASVPAEAEQDCVDTPTSKEGSWSYFIATADRGSQWIYAPIGSSTRVPNCGDFEGWVFTKTAEFESQVEPSFAAAPFECKK